MGTSEETTAPDSAASASPAPSPKSATVAARSGLEPLPEAAPPASPTPSRSRRGPRPALRRVLALSWAPLAVLGLVSLLSLGARVWQLDQPCATPCSTGQDHSLIFDEVYYVNAARRIDGIPVPAGGHYAQAPPGVDPNSEHPQLGKLIIAGSMRVLGDTPLAWRLGSLVFGSLAILGMFALVRAAGGSAWLGVAVAGLMAADNLLLVHGRIGTLDIYVLTLMIWALVLYLRGHHLGAGALLGVATCIKLVAPYLLIVVALAEVLRRLGASRSVTDREAMPTPGRQLRGYLSFVGVGAVVYLGLLTVMDQLVPPYDMLTAATYRGPFDHTGHMVRFAASLSDPGGAHGIASYPWQWLADYKPIVYFNVDVTRVVNGQNVLDSTTHFLGVVNPMILLFAIPAFALAALRIWRRGHDLDIVAVAWSAGTFLPFVLQSAIGHRISYLYYMVIIVPGIYIMVARLFASRRMRPWATALWACLVVAATVLMYPFLALPDPNWV